ncbi:MAG: lipid-transfer protein [Deltaproteobacteria bacterium]|nr:lipid-transfer protein [Deltaproteobacteria bacterium]
MRDSAAVIGIGHTNFRNNVLRTEVRMTVEATLVACDDAGIQPSHIDGMCTVSTDVTGENNLATALGLHSLRFFAEVPFGGGGTCAAVGLAAMAVASGRADTVLCYRALNGRTRQRLGGAQLPDPRFTKDFQFYIPAGLSTPAQIAAVIARRHMYQYGTTQRQLAAVALNSRGYAVTNPAARFFNIPLTLEDYAQGRMVADPLRLYDCCVDSDASVALLVTSAERARDCKQRPVYIMAVAQGMGSRTEMMPSFSRADITCCEEARECATALWRMAGIGPGDVDVAQIYDHFTPMVLIALEEYGFVAKGGSGPWVESGALGRDGALPTNTSGGQLGEAYVNGMNQIIEAVRQVRGTSVNQVPDVEISFASGGSGVPTSALLFRR